VQERTATSGGPLGTVRGRRSRECGAFLACDTHSPAFADPERAASEAPAREVHARGARHRAGRSSCSSEAQGAPGTNFGASPDRREVPAREVDAREVSAREVSPREVSDTS